MNVGYIEMQQMMHAILYGACWRDSLRTMQNTEFGQDLVWLLSKSVMPQDSIQCFDCIMFLKSHFRTVRFSAFQLRLVWSHFSGLKAAANRTAGE